MKFFRIKMNNKVSIVKGNHGKKGQIRRVSIPVHQGRSQDFSKGRGGGGHSRDTIRRSPTIYGLYHCSPSCISGLSHIIAA